MTVDFTFDLATVPFSRIGSYLGFSVINGILYLRNLSGSALNHPELVSLELMTNDSIISFEIRSSPSMLKLISSVGTVEICMGEQDRILLRGQNVDLRLIRHIHDNEFDYAFSPDGERWEIVAYESVIKLGLRALSGHLSVDAPWLGAKSASIVAIFECDDGKFEGIIQAFDSVWQEAKTPSPFDFDACVATVSQSYTTWLENTLPVSEQWEDARQLAAYINWSCTVSARGYHQRPAMLMSKNWMNKVWSWDNCFNALALIEQDPVQAWNQFILFFDHQDQFGAIPDHLTDTTMSWRFCKPPIHGWTMRKFMQTPDFITQEHLEEIYDPLCYWTQWWFNFRDDDRDGIPQYNHGNESGWDNGTVFAKGVPIESPDLTAYLIIQMDVLAEIARQLNKPNEAQDWQHQGQQLIENMMNHFWNGEQFVAKHSGTHQAIEGDSSLAFMPLLLGNRLKKSIQKHLVTGIQRFLTEHGIATENPQSKFYEADGYWRGPIWAPTTYLLVDGLRACGEDEVVHDIAYRFCRMASENGMAENYDALTGVGLRDRAYTWTSSVFLLLGNMLLSTEKG